VHKYHYAYTNLRLSLSYLEPKHNFMCIKIIMRESCFHLKATTQDLFFHYVQKYVPPFLSFHSELNCYLACVVLLLTDMHYDESL
jgi:hypothetical protein